MKKEHIQAAPVIAQICEELGYSRAHVAKALRENAARVHARKRGTQWTIREDMVERFRSLVETLSGPRYKLGETGAHVR